ncbi:MAG: methyltransferase domain-containing protein [Anaerolineales bacterium]|nr:methyltransferase domain-containing protein [Anaerolineales bacterium]
MDSTYTRSDSKVEVTGFEARHYDFFMNLITGGTYPLFIRQAVKDMRIQPADSVLDLGSGTGRNIILMNKYLSEEGRVVGLDIGSEMLEQALRRFANHPRVAIEKRRIEEPLPYQDEFNKVFISFVLHGLIQEDRLKVIDNAYRALKPGGEFLILDYNEFDLRRSPWLVRFAFKLECPLATDFIGRNLQAILREQSFDRFRVHKYYFGYVRLLAAHKPA